MKHAIALVSVCVATSLASCGGSQEPEPGTPASEELAAEEGDGGEAAADPTVPAGPAEGVETEPSDPETTEEVIETSEPL